MNFKKNIIIFIVVFVFGSLIINIAHAQSLFSRVRGYILLQVQAHGEAWYVNPDSNERLYLADGKSAFNIMRSLGLGITDNDLDKIPQASNTHYIKKANSICASNVLANRLRGRILLQVEQHGEAWYVDPKKCLRIYMKNGNIAFSIMRFLGLGISNFDLEKIPIFVLSERKNIPISQNRQQTKEMTQNQIFGKQLTPEDMQLSKYNILRDKNGKPLDPNITQYLGTPDCISNTNPKFSNHVTDMSKVRMVIPPGTIQGGVLKTHSYLEVTQRVPVYTPVDSVLFGGQFYEQAGDPQYLLSFQVSCEVQYIFDHILEPIQKIKNAFPAVPSNSTRGNPIKYSIKFKAGDLVGYTFGTPEAHTWDFGVYNLARPKEPQTDKPYMASIRYDYADCPYEYFPSPMKQEYKSKYGTFHNPMPTEYCSDVK